MATLRHIQMLFEVARRAPAPVFRVSDQVLAEIDMAGVQTLELRPLSFFACLSAAAALAMLVYVANCWSPFAGVQAADFINPVIFEIW